MNDAYRAEQANPHVHWHVWPRYKNPVRINYIMLEDLNFAHQYDKSAARAADATTLISLRKHNVWRLRGFGLS